MADKIKTLEELQEVLPDNNEELVSAQDIRNFLVSCYNWVNKAIGGDIYYNEGNVGIGDFSASAIPSLFSLKKSGAVTIANIESNDFESTLIKTHIKQAWGSIPGKIIEMNHYDTPVMALNLLYGGGWGLGVGVDNVFFLRNDGKMGIGTISPTSAAGIDKFIQISGTSSGIILEDTDSAALDWEIYHNETSLQFYYNAVNRVTFEAGGLVSIAGNRFALRTASDGLANNAAGTIGDMAFGTDGGKTYKYIWFATNTPSRVELVTW